MDFFQIITCISWLKATMEWADWWFNCVVAIRFDVFSSKCIQHGRRWVLPWPCVCFLNRERSPSYVNCVTGRLSRIWTCDRALQCKAGCTSHTRDNKGLLRPEHRVGFKIWFVLMKLQHLAYYHLFITATWNTIRWSLSIHKVSFQRVKPEFI